MAKTIATLLLAALALLAFACGAKSMKPFASLDVLLPHQQEEALRLIPAFDRLNGHLERIQTDESAVLIGQMKKLLTRKSSPGLIEKLLAGPETDLIEALTLFTSLPDAAESCDYNGYRILAQNFLAMEADKADDSSSKCLRVLEEFVSKHMLLCRDYYSDIELKRQTGQHIRRSK